VTVMIGFRRGAIGGRGGKASAREGVGVVWWMAAVVHCHCCLGERWSERGGWACVKRRELRRLNEALRNHRNPAPTSKQPLQPRSKTASFALEYSHKSRIEGDTISNEAVTAVQL
jgi:hypothetical protein